MRLHKGSRTALVLAGGGITGAVYEIGALRAINDLLVDRTINDFDIFVGTSAGAFVASFLANGIPPETMLEVLSGDIKDIEPIQRKHIFSLNRKDYLKWGTRLPKKLLTAWVNSLNSIQDISLFDFAWLLADALPSGFYDSLGLANYVRAGLNELGKTDQFDELSKELYIVATDLDNGTRAIFGPGHLEAQISYAVAASSALPLVYKPVRIGEREYIDGGMRGTASIDIAIEHGATLIVCINPLVPYYHSHADDSDHLELAPRYLADRGVQSITNQALRITLHSGLHYHIKQLRRSHPEVDIILIEPRQKDYRMFYYNIMHYGARLLVAQHGFESVTYDLAKDYHLYKETLARHKIPITRRLVIEELAEIEASHHDPQVIRRVMEARAGGCGPGRVDTPACRLSRALMELETLLDLINEEEDESLQFAHSMNFD